MTPDCLAAYPNVAPKYASATFDRAIATRKKKAELLGIGHPLIDALVSYLKVPPFSAEVACLPGHSTEHGNIDIRYRVTWDRADHGSTSEVVTVRLNGDAKTLDVSTDPQKLQTGKARFEGEIPQDSQQRGNEAIRIWINSWRTELPGDTIPRVEPLGLSVLGV